MEKHNLFIITGMSGSGKSTLAVKLSNQLHGAIVFSVDDFKRAVYEKYEFVNREENRLLNNLAKLQFQAKLMAFMRDGSHDNIIVEYPFNQEWNQIFKSLANRYGYRRIVVNCVSTPFEIIWNRKLKRDNDPQLRPRCLVADGYVGGKVTAIDPSDFDKERHWQEYESGMYSKIEGDVIMTDKELSQKLEKMP